MSLTRRSMNYRPISFLYLNFWHAYLVTIIYIKICIVYRDNNTSKNVTKVEHKNYGVLGLVFTEISSNASEFIDA